MVEVLAVFNTSIGFTTILKFPENVRPKMGMKLRKREQLYYVTGIAFQQPMSDEFAGDDNYSCVLKSNLAIDLKVGDVLDIV
jgi:hypothetical protein